MLKMPETQYETYLVIKKLKTLWGNLGKVGLVISRFKTYIGAVFNFPTARIYRYLLFVEKTNSSITVIQRRRHILSDDEIDQLLSCFEDQPLKREYIDNED